MAARCRYAPEQRSKRFVTKLLRSPVLITDLVPRWRTAWRDLPRAKLWCEPWSDAGETMSEGLEWPLEMKEQA